MKIMIIRHGEPDYSIDSLTEKGWREVNLLSERLAKLDIDKIFCSPLGRAKDTAKPTLEKLKKEATLLDWMQEFRGQISPYGKRKQEFPWDLPAFEWAYSEEFFDKNQWFNAPIVNTGNSKEIFDETAKGIDEILLSYGYKRDGMMYRCDKENNKTIVLFCHFALGATIISYLTGIAPTVMWHNFFLAPSSVSTLVTGTLRKGETNFRCIQFGDISHLYSGNEQMSKAGLMPEMFDPNDSHTVL